MNCQAQTMQLFWIPHDSGKPPLLVINQKDLKVTKIYDHFIWLNQPKWRFDPWTNGYIYIMARFLGNLFPVRETSPFFVNWLGGGTHKPSERPYFLGMDSWWSTGRSPVGLPGVLVAQEYASKFMVSWRCVSCEIQYPCTTVSWIIIIHKYTW